MLKYQIADVIFSVLPIYKYTVGFLKDYAYSGDKAPEFSVSVTDNDIQYEKELSGEDYPLAIFETLAILRKFCEYMVANANGFIFHSSAIMVDGKAYLFTAPSGTGKSTHARLWCEMLKSKAVMINDDKPIVRLIDGKYYAFGTPWQGKHGLGANVRAEVKAICKISQSTTNRIKKISVGEAFDTVLNQTLRPSDERVMNKLLNGVEGLLKSCDLYALECDISRQACELSYGVMAKGELC